MKRLALILLLALPLAPPLMAQQRFAGRPLADALRDLQSRGLRLIYSDDVVTPAMRVAAEPRAIEPRKILDELLREHALRAKKGPRGSLLIVRDAPRRSRTVAPSSPPPEMPIALEEIIVTPSRFTILGDEPPAKQFLGRDEVRRLPHFSDDLYRAIGRVPGIAVPDVSARFNLRGGDQDEVLVLVDGAEIYDPFHVRDLSRAFSTIDAEAVGSVELLSGGYPAEYGGRMSGVVDISTATPDSVQHEVGLSLLNARVLSQGVFAKGSWLLSLRHGYLGEALKMLDETSDFDPRYYDLLGKVERTLGNSAIASLHVLAASDRLRLREDPGTDAHAKYDDRYAWLNVRGTPSPRWYAQSVLSYGSLARDRAGHYDNDAESQDGTLDDRRSMQFVALKNDATFDLSPHNLVKLGATAKRLHARYDYDGSSHVEFASFQLGAPPRDIVRSVHVRPSGSEVSAYVADRVRLSDRVVVEAGIRAASEGYTPDGVNVSPRLNAAWTLSPRTSIRAAWGLFHQPQSMHELQVEDGLSEFGSSQRAEHRVVGIEHLFRGRVHARLELYDKLLTRLRPRYENVFDTLLIFPELRADRMRISPERGKARGAELLLRTDPTARWSGWISGTLAHASDVIDGVEVPRSWDQRHAMTFSVNHRRTVWNVNVAGTYHSGWPTTPVSAHLVDGRVVSEPGPRGAARLPAYHRVDIRVSRSSGPLSLFLEVLNVLDHTNVTRIDGFDFTIAQDGAVSALPREESVLGILPSFGVTWRF
ncbi:MAG TPA: TonB-dependent receptor [Thermoanaerobaculia bacterium]|nr:TonB-dependent receptor [Thermoanaerobaculia bacterium]